MRTIALRLAVLLVLLCAAGCGGVSLESSATFCNQRDQFYFPLVEMNRGEQTTAPCTGDYNDNGIEAFADECDFPINGNAPGCPPDFRTGWIPECEYQDPFGDNDGYRYEQWSLACRDYWQDRGLTLCAEYAEGDFTNIVDVDKELSDFERYCPQEDVDFYWSWQDE